MPEPTLAPTADLRAQLITLSGIARLAAVQRPVVTVWRGRFADGPDAFPSPRTNDDGTELFDAGEVAHWLVETRHGNNPNALAEAALYAKTGGGDIGLDAITAMLALHAVHGGPLGGLDADDLLDLADEIDPDDACLFRELERLGADAPGMARLADELADAAYTASAAFERVLADRSRGGVESSRLVPEASALVSELAIELALTNPRADAGAPCFVDPTGVAGDRLVDLAARLDELAEVAIISADSDAAPARLLRRRLLALGVARTGLTIGSAGDFEVRGAVVHVAQFPTSAAPTASPFEMLNAVEQIVLQMDDAQRGLVLAPASVLVNGGLDPEAAKVRSALLRAGRVRAVVALPAGLAPAHPRQRLALWALGPAHASVPIAERWTLLADLRERELSDAVRGDLVGDLAAAMGDRETVRAHAFGLARLVPMSRLLARSGSLLADVDPVLHTPRETGASVDAAELPARVDEALQALGGTAPAFARRIEPADAAVQLPPALLGRLAEERHVRCLPGARIGAADVSTGAGFTVIGPDEVAGTRTPGARTIDRLLLADRYPSARLTEPGDVVFVTSPRPRAWVDERGSSVVIAPARVLRISATDAAGLVPEVLAADVSGQLIRSRDWRAWRARRVVQGQGAPLAAVFRDIRDARDEARRRIDDLTRLESLITAGVTAGTLKLAELVEAPPPVE
ncbi:hypothetical protein J7E25_13495 [Agromyces sp. ISL-38]|uniref:hypothetical protein n=1 Tax=Agromyces sp. ISL-38 TaxID=2819107 RepID=UPI001BEC0643|nr:hypothetical protein [Agromyces sp. ISL-38]MBT2500101.1 hypothetical protein [Agromyces sp. ISL-38]